MMTRETLATLFLLIVVATPVLIALFCWSRTPLRPLPWLLYLVNLVLVRVLWRAELPGGRPLPTDQGAVIICNHRSSIDPCFVQVVAGPRHVHWMVAQLYNKATLIDWFLTLCEIIPVERRGGELSATKMAMRWAAQGELVGILPEGRINKGDQFMLSVRPGAVLIALKARVPILPCYIAGSPYHDVPWKPVLMPARVRLKVGKLIDLSQHYGTESANGVVQQLTIECVREIAKLAGREDFEPRLAGRGWKTWE